MTEDTVRILVVDDNEAGRYLKCHLLRKHGFTVSEAGFGKEALAACEAEPPGIILLDVKLPDISGIEVCRLVKVRYPGVAILQTSAAFNAPHERTAALEGGADGLLIEPIEPEELIASVKALRRIYQAEYALRHLNETLEKQVAERTADLEEANRKLGHEIAERRKAESILWHAQKLDALGQLTGGIAHDFNNLLAVIIGSLDMVHGAFGGQRKLKPETVNQLIEAARTAADRGAQVTQQLLAFARRSILNVETLDLADVLGNYADFIRRAIGEAIELDVSFEPELFPCRVDRAQLEAAILNLAVNARDAMQGGGKLTVRAANTIATGAEPPDLEPGAYASIRISDTGSGMPPDVLARAFEPFFTTKEVGKGSGLGLSQVYGFVMQSGGRVTVESEAGRGTSFTLHLPKAEGPAVSAAVAPDAGGADVPGGSETILVVEDNAEVLATVVAALESLGYAVLTAANAGGALECLDAHQDIDMLFTDVVMPGGVSGFELAGQARARREGMKILVTSGFTDVRVQAPVDKWPIILKPYSLRTLAAKVRQLLDG